MHSFFTCTACHCFFLLLPLIATDIFPLNTLGIEVQLNLKGSENSSAKKGSSSARGKRSSEPAEKKGGGRGSGSASKRKR